MLLRWILQQAVQQTLPPAEEASRQSPPTLPHGAPAAGGPQGTDPAKRTDPPLVAASRAEPEAYLPCDAALIFALGIEAGGVVDQLEGAETSRLPHGIEHAGRWQGREVVVVEGGVGAAAAARATSEAIRFYRPRYVISAGFAGGLVEELRRGQIVLAREVVDATGQVLQVGLELAAAPSPGLHIGRLLTVETLLRTPAERRQWAERRQALACDMETFAVARACKELGVPLIAVRIISDTLEDELPPEIAHLLKQKTWAGRLGAATGAIFRRLGAARDLWRLHEEAIKASDRLARFLGGLVQQLPPVAPYQAP